MPSRGAHVGVLARQNGTKVVDFCRLDCIDYVAHALVSNSLAV
jgi:hypothetical protein